MLTRLSQWWAQKNEQWERQRQQLRAELLKDMERSTVAAVHKAHEQFEADVKEFGLDTLFVRERCKNCGDGKLLTHREIMRSQGLSGNHQASWGFAMNHFKLSGAAYERRQRWY